MDGSEAKPPLLHLSRSLLSFPKHAKLRSLVLFKVGSGGQERERVEDSGWGFAGEPLPVHYLAHSVICVHASSVHATLA